MDESWRMRMGMPTDQSRHRRSTEDRRNPISDDPFTPEDFSDVFGGPPRTIFARQFSAGFPRSSSSSTNYFYEEVFQPARKAAAPVGRSGRNLPEFRIPGQGGKSDHSKSKGGKINGFYSDIFGWDDEMVVRSRSRSKTSSSSVLSSEELSPLRAAFSGDGDDDIYFFGPKLRPINVKCKWSSTRMGYEDYQRQQNIMPQFAGIHNQPIHNTENNSPTDNLRSYPFGISRRNASPETISLEPISNGSFRVSADDLELNSPSSAISSVCQSDRDIEDDEILKQDDMEDEAMSSYVIEINSENREGTCESNGVDEAIAWAKEKFQTSQEETLNGRQVSEGHTDSFGSLDEQQDKWAAVEDTIHFECTAQTEMQILDAKIKLWSTGKEADIRLLLSSLHQILWPNSGWLPIPLVNIIEISQVKKAYQKARLCLHPDKLQQRGATLPQKYIAEKAFTVLQDAWAAFISRDVF